jgi:hypothetical protein
VTLRLIPFALAAFVLVSAQVRAEFSFVVIGDTPYDAQDQRMLDAAVAETMRLKPPFVIHLGDFKGGKAPCDGSADEAFAGLIEALKPIPVFATPGDNEWTDCDRHDDPKTGRPYSELARLAELRRRFHEGPPTGGQALRGERQAAQAENQRWSYGGALFVTVHVVGTSDGLSYVNGDPLEQAFSAHAERRKANIAWIAESAEMAKAAGSEVLVFAFQGDPMDVSRQSMGKSCSGAAEALNPCDAFIEVRAALQAAAAAFGGPVLVIHGDTEPFTLGRFPGGAASSLWRLNAAGDAGVGAGGFAYGVRDVTLVTVTGNAGTPFAARGLTTGRAARRSD